MLSHLRRKPSRVRSAFLWRMSLAADSRTSSSSRRVGNAKVMLGLCGTSTASSASVVRAMSCKGAQSRSATKRVDAMVDSFMIADLELSGRHCVYEASGHSFIKPEEVT